MLRRQKNRNSGQTYRFATLLHVLDKMQSLKNTACVATCAESFLDLTPKLHPNAGFMPAFMVHGSIYRTTYAFPDVVFVPSYS